MSLKGELFPRLGALWLCPRGGTGWGSRGQLVTVVTGVWGGVSLQELSRLRDVVASGSCQRDQPSMGKVRVELHLSKTPSCP